MIELNKVMELISIKTREFNDNLGGKKGALSKIKGQLSFLKIVVAYLESGPSDEFLAIQISRLENRKAKIMKSYTQWIPSEYYASDKDRMKAFEKLNDLPKIRMQVRALRYIANT